MQRILSVRLVRSIALVATLTAAACSNSNTMTDSGVHSDVPTGSDRPQTGNDVPTGTDVHGDTPISTSCGGGFGPCNPVTNDGCTGADSCVIVSDGDGGTTTMCAPAGTVAYGSACTTANDCALGFSCLDSICTHLCCGTGDDARCNAMGHTNGVCTTPVTFAGTTAMVYACTLTTNCDWLTQNCTGGQNCVPVAADGTTTCTTAGTHTAGMACSSPTDCARGTYCVMAAGATTAMCAQICDPTMADAGAAHGCSGSGMQCASVTGEPRTFGVCVAAMTGN